MQQDIHTERPIQTNRSRLAKIVVLSLLGICLLNVLARQQLKALPIEMGHFLISSKWQMLQDCGPKDIVVLGDSTAAFSLDPELLHQESGLSCVNLGTVGGLLVLNDVWMLDAYIKKWGAPRVVLMIHEGVVWEADRLTAEYLSSIPIDISPDSTTKGPIVISKLERWKVFASEYLTLYSRHLSVASLVKKGPGGRVVELSAGGFPLQPKGSFDPHFPPDSTSLARVKENRPFTISSVNSKALKAVQLFCRENHCPLILAKAPVFEDIAKAEGFSKFDQSFQAYFDEVIQTDANAVYIFRQPFVYTREEGNDDVHLNPKGAQRYTRELADEIKRLSGGG